MRWSGPVYRLRRRPDMKLVHRLTGLDESPMLVRSSLEIEDEAGRQPTRCGVSEIVAVARPGVVVKVEVQFERVAVYVPGSGKQLRIGDDRHRRKATSKEWTVAGVTGVEPLRVPTRQALHCKRQSCCGAMEYEVKVITHEAVAGEFNASGLDRQAGELQEGLAIGVIREDRRASKPSIHNVVPAARRVESRFPWHRRTLRGPSDNLSRTQTAGSDPTTPRPRGQTPPPTAGSDPTTPATRGLTPLGRAG